jgi:hypothetical protein
MTNSFLAIWEFNPMSTESAVQDEVRVLMDDFRLRLIELISTKRPGEYTSDNLPQLYALASKHCPRLHQDPKLCELHNALGRKKSGETDPGSIVYFGIDAWMATGMSPIIYFSKPTPDGKIQVSMALLERIYATRRMTPDRGKLLGNLSLVQFSHFLADRVALNRMRYPWLCALLSVMPELIAPENWKNLCHGHIKVHAKIRKKQIDSKISLKILAPLLLIGIGQGAKRYHQAKKALGIHGPSAMDYTAREAFAAANKSHGKTVLERFIRWEYGGWDTPQLDRVLSDYLRHYQFFTRYNYFELQERVWFQKAVETLAQPHCKKISWPAALYGKFLSHTNRADEYEGRGQFHWKTLLKMVPELRAIQGYVTQVDSPLISALQDTLECCLLVHPIFLAQFPESLRAPYALEVAPYVADHMTKDMSYGVFERYETPQATERTLQRYDPDCVKAVGEWARHSKNIRELNCRLQGHVSILWLMIRNLRGEHNKGQAIEWCTRLRSQRTKFEAMRLLDLTLEDVRLSPSLHDEFLTRDLGL